MTRPRLLVTLLSTLLTVCAAVPIASAQSEGALPPPASSPPPAAAHRSAPGGRGFGVGGISYLSGLNGLSLVYDPGVWHLDAMVGMFGDGWGGADTAINFGARFWYHLKTWGAADFSVGGGMSYQHFDPGPQDSTSLLFIEGGGLIRVFIVDNVALGASTGLVIGAVDAGGYGLGVTDLVGSASLHYFF